MEIIKANNVVYEYIRRDEEGNVEGITRAVNDVSLDIEQGQFIAILGHNGSGKSTLAKHMNAILNPTEGTLWVDGMDTKDEDNIWKVRQTAGMVFQNPDNPREIFSQVEQLKKLRLDVPQVTLLSYELQKRGIPLPDGILTREELVSALGYGKTDRK